MNFEVIIDSSLSLLLEYNCDSFKKNEGIIVVEAISIEVNIGMPYIQYYGCQDAQEKIRLEEDVYNINLESAIFITETMVPIDLTIKNYAEKVSSNLTSSVSSGRFVALLQRLAREKGSISFETIRDANISLSSHFKNDDNDHPLDFLNNAGVSTNISSEVLWSIVGFVFLLISFLLFYCHRKRKHEKRVFTSHIVEIKTDLEEFGGIKDEEDIRPASPVNEIASSLQHLDDSSSDDSITSSSGLSSVSSSTDYSSSNSSHYSNSSSIDAYALVEKGNLNNLRIKPTKGFKINKTKNINNAHKSCQLSVFGYSLSNDDLDSSKSDSSESTTTSISTLSLNNSDDNDVGSEDDENYMYPTGVLWQSKYNVKNFKPNLRGIRKQPMNKMTKTRKHSLSERIAKSTLFTKSSKTYDESNTVSEIVNLLDTHQGEESQVNGSNEPVENANQLDKINDLEKQDVNNSSDEDNKAKVEIVDKDEESEDNFSSEASIKLITGLFKKHEKDEEKLSKLQEYLLQLPNALDNEI